MPRSECRPATWCTCRPVKEASARASTASTSPSTVGVMTARGRARSTAPRSRQNIADVGIIVPSPAYGAKRGVQACLDDLGHYLVTNSFDLAGLEHRSQA